MVARFRKFLGVVGILAAAAFGTQGLLTNSSDPDGSRYALIIAAAGLVLWVQALAIGDHKHLWQFAGAVGLLLVAVLGPLTLMVLLTDPPAAPPLLA
jgi:hypothetical protein